MFPSRPASISVVCFNRDLLLLAAARFLARLRAACSGVSLCRRQAWYLRLCARLAAAFSGVSTCRLKPPRAPRLTVGVSDLSLSRVWAIASRFFALLRSACCGVSCRLFLAMRSRSVAFLRSACSGVSFCLCLFLRSRSFALLTTASSGVSCCLILAVRSRALALLRAACCISNATCLAAKLFAGSLPWRLALARRASGCALAIA
eukprot:scaffold217450_cov32-Prasinocladus_malaysianus.AAC.1